MYRAVKLAEEKRYIPFFDPCGGAALAKVWAENFRTDFDASSRLFSSFDVSSQMLASEWAELLANELAGGGTVQELPEVLRLDRLQVSQVFSALSQIYPVEQWTASLATAALHYSSDRAAAVLFEELDRAAGPLVDVALAYVAEESGALELAQGDRENYTPLHLHALAERALTPDR
jgi:hypothetical protein